MTQGMENGIEEGRGGVTFSFSGLLSEMQTQSKSTTSQMRLLFSEFLLYLATEFKTGWETSWQSFKEISSRNIQSIITDINALNAKLASIERNITITITTVYKSVGGSGSSSSSKSSTARSAARVADMPATLRGRLDLRLPS